MNLSWIDILILLPILVGLVRGLMRGLVTELIAILGVVLGVLGARVWGKMFTAWLLTTFTWPEAVCRLVAYTLLFLGIAIVCNWCGRLLGKLLRAIHLGWLNRLLGGAFGTLKWAIVVLVLVFIVHQADAAFHFLQPEVKAESVCYGPAVQTTQQIWNYTSR